MEKRKLLKVSPLTVAAVQMNVELGDKKKNLRTAEKLIDSSKREINFYVLPELFITGYNLRLAHEWAEPIPGHTTDVPAELAMSHRTYLIGSFLEAIEDAKPKNTCVVMDPTGKLVAKYSKIHLFRLANEHVFLSAGDSVTDF